MAWVTYGEYFGWKGTILSNARWSGKTRDIRVSYGVEILADDYSVMSQIHASNRRTDGRTAIPLVALHAVEMISLTYKVLTTSQPIYLKNLVMDRNITTPFLCDFFLFTSRYSNFFSYTNSLKEVNTLQTMIFSFSR